MSFCSSIELCDPTKLNFAWLISASYVIDVQAGKQLQPSAVTWRSSNLSRKSLCINLSSASSMHFILDTPHIFVSLSPAKLKIYIKKCGLFIEIAIGNLLGIENLTHPHSCFVKLERHSSSQFCCVYILKKRNWRSESKKHCRRLGA